MSVLDTYQLGAIDALKGKINDSLIDSIVINRLTPFDTGHGILYREPYVYQKTVKGRLITQSGSTNPFVNNPVYTISMGDVQPYICLLPPDSGIKINDQLIVTNGLTNTLTGTFKVLNVNPQDSFLEIQQVIVQQEA